MQLLWPVPKSAEKVHAVSNMTIAVDGDVKHQM